MCEYYKVLLGGYALSNINLDINVEVEKKECRLIYRLSKRVIDILGSFTGLVLLSPILIIVGILIKFESKGPIVFTQKRVGKDGKEFDMYKLRSMVVNAEEIKEKLKEQNEMSGPMFKIKDDPRITRIGKFIRKTSIDELPQLVNVLKGDMSLVGPRPSLPNEVKEFESWMLKRLSVKPGLTCYWQVMGRNSVGFEEWMKLDIKYIDERSFMLDLRLIFKTFFLLFGDENAN